MQTTAHAGSPTWMDLAGADTIARVTQAIRADPAFLAEAEADLNGAIERRMGIRFPVPLTLKVVGDVGYVWPSNGSAVSEAGELTDAELDLVSGGNAVPKANGTPPAESPFGSPTSGG